MPTAAVAGEPGVAMAEDEDEEAEEKIEVAEGESLEDIKAKLKPKKAILTNMHNDLDYEAIKQETPENVEPAHDGLIINL